MFYFNEPDQRNAQLVVTTNCLDFKADPHSVCCCSLPEVRELVCWNHKRKMLWLGLEAFLAHWVTGRNFSHLNLVGPYVSRAERPQVVDAVLQTRVAYGPDTATALEPFFKLGLEKIRARYGVRLGFWVKGAPELPVRPQGFASRDDRRVSFQDHMLRHGIVRIALDD